MAADEPAAAIFFTEAILFAIVLPPILGYGKAMGVIAVYGDCHSS
jgi:hypothetical protein